MSLLAVLVCGCPAPRTDAGNDVDDGRLLDDIGEPADAVPDDFQDVDVDALTDAHDEGGDEASGDAPPDCDYVGVQAECDPWESEYVPPPEWEPPSVDCGPGCRQISWGAYRFSVWGRRAVLMRDRRLFAVDLDTLEHRQVACTYSPIPVPPLDNVSREVVYDIAIAIRGADLFYARWVRVPDSQLCDWLTEFRAIAWDSGANTLLHVVGFPNPAIADPGCEAGDVDQVAAFDAHGAFVMIDTDCHAYLFGIDLTTGAVRRYEGTPGGLFISNVWNAKIALATPGEVYLVDLDTGVRTNLSNDPADQTLPALYENVVVWEDFRHAPAGFGFSPVFDVYLHDTSTGESRRVTSDTTARFPPRVFRDAVVWSDVRDSTSPSDRYPEADVWMFDMATGEERQVTALPGTEYDLQLWDGLVYFRWRRPGVIRTMDEALCECPLPTGP